MRRVLSWLGLVPAMCLVLPMQAHPAEPRRITNLYDAFGAPSPGAGNRGAGSGRSRRLPVRVTGLWVRSRRQSGRSTTAFFQRQQRRRHATPQGQTRAERQARHRAMDVEGQHEQATPI